MIRSRSRNRKAVSIVRGIIILAFILGIGFWLTGFFSNATWKQNRPSIYKYYTSVRIQSGESLWSLSQKYGTQGYDTSNEYIQEIREINDLQDDNITYGEFLTIPYYSSELK